MIRTMLSTALSFTTKLAACAGLSSSSCAPFSLVFPALLNFFFPVPFSFPVFACPCVPVHRGSCVCAPVLFPCIVVPVFVLWLCSCSGVLIPRPCIVLAFPSRSFSWARVPCPIPWGPCVMSHSCVWSCLAACHLPLWHAYYLSSLSLMSPLTSSSCFHKITVLHSDMMHDVSLSQMSYSSPFSQNGFHRTNNKMFILRFYARLWTGPEWTENLSMLMSCSPVMLLFSESQRRECGRSNIVISHSPYDIGNMFYLFQQTTFCPMLWPSLLPEPEPTCATALRLKQNATTIPFAESQSHPSAPI